VRLAVPEFRSPRQVIKPDWKPGAYFFGNQGVYPVVSLPASRTSTGTEGPMVEAR
jgi:hypothetical protein